MTPVDPMAVAVDRLDCYRAGRINQMVGMYSRNAVIDCGCGGNKTVYGAERIAAYWQNRFLNSPALDLVDLQIVDGAVAITYRRSAGIVEALLDVTEDGLIAYCSCGPV